MNRDVRSRRLDAGIDGGILFLLVFTPLAFGSVQDWSAAVMDAAAYTVLGLWLISRYHQDQVRLQDRRLLGLIAACAGIVLLQIVPLPAPLLKTLSPSTWGVYRDFSGAPPDAWHSISIHPWATQQGILRMFSYASVFIVIINHVREQEQINRMVKAIVALGAFVVVFALVQKATWNGRIYWVYPTEAHDETVRNFSIWGPFVNRNHFAGYIAMIIPLGLALFLYRITRSGRFSHRSWTNRLTTLLSSSGFFVMGIWGILSLVMTAAVFMTLSRGGIISLTCSVAVLFFLTRQRKRLGRITAPFAVLGLLLSLMIVIAGWDRLAERFEQLAEDRTLQRADVWKDSLHIIQDFPLLGTGLGTFGSIYSRYQTHGTTRSFDHAHNDFVELLTDTGLIGFVAVVAMAGVFLVMVIRQWRTRHRTYVKALGAGGIASCVSLLIHGITDFNFHIPANAMLWTIVAGITYAVVFNLGRSGEAA
jgi:O-antigen ligase